MRVHNADESHRLLQWIALCLKKDPYSLAAWRCLIVEPTTGQEPDLRLLQVMAAAGLDCDGDLLTCPDGSLLLFSQKQYAGALERIAAAICSGWDAAPLTYAFDIGTDWRDLCAFLSHSIPDGSTPEIEFPAEWFGEVQALGELFTQAKMLRPARHPQYVLLVEDDPLTQHAVSTMLKQNYVVISATNAKDAVGKYLQYAPDIVFLDLGLPDASGYCVLRQLLEQDKDAYIVMFTGQNSISTISQSVAGGAAGYIGKPFKRENLLHYIEDSVMHHHKEYRV